MSRFTSTVVVCATVPFAFGCSDSGGDGTWDGKYQGPGREVTVVEPALSSEGPNERGKKELAECDFEDLTVSDLQREGVSNGDIKKPGSDNALNFVQVTDGTTGDLIIYDVLCRPASDV